MVSSRVFCSFASVFLPRFAAGDEPVSVLRLVPAAEGELVGSEPDPDFEAMRADDLVAGILKSERGNWQLDALITRGLNGSTINCINGITMDRHD